MNIKIQTENVIKEVIEKCKLSKGDVLVVGCSSSEVVGSKIGTNSNVDVASEIFEGKDLHLNFSTSAYGYIYVDVLDEEGNPLSEKESFEIFGDTLDRTICFADGSDFSEYANKPVRLRFRMRDAKIFSIKFN